MMSAAVPWITELTASRARLPVARADLGDLAAAEQRRDVTVLAACSTAFFMNSFTTNPRRAPLRAAASALLTNRG
jgi:hypothetical protein